MGLRTRRKVFHISVIIVIIVAIFFTVGIMVLRYHVEGETNLPFEISKIRLISSTSATDNKDDQSKWNLTLDQNNDIYIYIEKNKEYEKTEIIQDITIDNFKIDKQKEIGINAIYKPTAEENMIFKNVSENEVQNITFKSALENNIKELKISNQGGMIAFRYSNQKLATYISNAETEINYNNLLKLTNVNEDDLKLTLSFDLTMNLKSGKKFKANIQLDVPEDGIVEQGTASSEITELNNIVFKRIENN